MRNVASVTKNGTYEDQDFRNGAVLSMFALAMTWSDLYLIRKLGRAYFYHFFRCYDFVTNNLLGIALILRFVRLEILMNEISTSTMEEIEVAIFANVIVLTILRYTQK